jgi:hypothetical protein
MFSSYGRPRLNETGGIIAAGKACPRIHQFPTLLEQFAGTVGGGLYLVVDDMGQRYLCDLSRKLVLSAAQSRNASGSREL